jgi:hypothetical protein
MIHKKQTKAMKIISILISIKVYDRLFYSEIKYINGYKGENIFLD